MNMKIVLKPLRDSLETLSSQNQITLRNFQHQSKFLVSYKKNVYNFGRFFRPITCMQNF